jgi:hypothetical protein
VLCIGATRPIVSNSRIIAGPEPTMPYGDSGLVTGASIR